MEPKSCRVCLQPDKLISLFNSIEGVLIVDILEFCMNIPIIKDGNLPQYICKSCLTNLKRSNIFKKEFLKSDELLKNLLKDPSAFKEEMDIFEEVEVKCEPVSRFDDEDIDDLNDPVQTSPIKQENSVSIFESETGDFDATFVEILNVSNIDIKPAAKLKPAKKVSKTQDPSKAPYVLPTNHSCFICDLKFFSNQKKNEHIFQVHEKESAYACTIRSYVLETAKLLDTHMRMHKIQPNVFCESCGKAFFNMNCLNKHRQLVHSNVEYIDCDQCDLKIKTLAGLRKHKLVKHDRHKLLCDKCHFTTSQKVSLAVHMSKNHNAEARIKCPDCMNVFNTNSTVRNHQEKWKGTCVTLFKPRIRNPQCPICNRIFKRRGHEFTQHINSHTDNREFLCPICNKGFYSTNSMMKHKRGCENLRNFKCSTCQKGFNSAKVLEIHERSHNGINPFKCAICPKAFASKKYVYRHQKEIHDYYRPAEKTGKKKI